MSSVPRPISNDRCKRADGPKLARLRADDRGCGNGAMVEPLRHRQTKGAETDMPSLPPPRHIPTLPHRKTRLALGSDRNGASLCENVRKPRMRRMVFLYCLLLIAPPELLVFRLTKSRRTFYAHDERLSFRTASGMKSGSRRQD